MIGQNEAERHPVFLLSGVWVWSILLPALRLPHNAFAVLFSQFRHILRITAYIGLEPDAFLSCINILSVPYTVFSNTMHLHTHNHDQSVLFEVSIMTGCNNKLLDKAPRSSIFWSSLSLVKDEFFLNSAFWP